MVSINCVLPQYCRHFEVDTHIHLILISHRSKTKKENHRQHANVTTHTHSVSKVEEKCRKCPGDSVKRAHSVHFFPSATLPHCLPDSAGKKKTA